MTLVATAPRTIFERARNTPASTRAPANEIDVGITTDRRRLWDRSVLLRFSPTGTIKPPPTPSVWECARNGVTSRPTTVSTTLGNLIARLTHACQGSVT